MNTEIKAGGLVAIGGLAQAVVYGLLAFAPLGAQGMAYGVYAGLASALLGGVVGGFLGKAPVQFGGPRSSTALIIAGSLFGFMSITQQTEQLLLLVGAEVVLAALLVALAQRQGLGKLMQYLPAPVLIGLNTTLGLFSAYKLIPAMLGFAVYTTLWQVPANALLWSAPALVVSMLTLAALVYCRVVQPTPYGLLLGLAVGLTAHTALVALWPGTAAPTLGIEAQTPFNALANTPWQHLHDTAILLAQHPTLLVQMGAGALVIALLIVLESMQSMLQVDQALNTRHNTRTELNALAWANLLCGFMMALPSSNYFSRSNAGLGMGSTSRRSELWYTAALALALLVAWPWLALLPLAMLATLVAVSSLFLIQGSTVQLFAKCLHRRSRQSLSDTERFTVIVVVGMLLVTALSNLLLGALAGVLFAAVYFLRQQSDTGLHSITTQPSARSRTMRPRAQRQGIDSAFQHLKWVRFEGNLFFGNSPAICIRLQDELKGTPLVLLDFSKMRYIDDTAASGLARCLRLLSGQASALVAVLPANINPASAGLPLLENALASAQVPTQWHIDDAFHAMEEHALGKSKVGETGMDAEQTLQASHLCDGLDQAQTADLLRMFQAQTLQTGKVLFHEGDPPGGLYILQEGQLSAWQQVGNSSERLMRFCPGSLVGEMALIDHKARSATLVAEHACTVLSLPLGQWQRLQAQHPDIAHIVLGNLAKELALRIRLSNLSLALLQ